MRDIAIRESEDGISLDISLGNDSLHRYLAGRRVRQLRGHTSCGLCGVEDLKDVLPSGISRRAGDSPGCGAPLFLQWTLCERNSRSAATPGGLTPLLGSRLRRRCDTVREDVGRHNSLDKLIGALLRSETPSEGFCLITSRCSFEMVQKAMTAGFSTLVSAGMPTALAVRSAAAAGLTLYSLSRDGEPLQFTSPVHVGGNEMATARKLGPDLEVKPYEDAAGGWGSVRSLVKSLARDHVPLVGSRVLLKQNKTDGFMCVSCAWAKPADPRVVRILREWRQGDDLGNHPQARHA